MAEQWREYRVGRFQIQEQLFGGRMGMVSIEDCQPGGSTDRKMRLLDEEEVRDLHYALTRVIAHLDEGKKERK